MAYACKPKNRETTRGLVAVKDVAKHFAVTTRNTRLAILRYECQVSYLGANRKGYITEADFQRLKDNWVPWRKPETPKPKPKPKAQPPEGYKTWAWMRKIHRYGGSSAHTMRRVASVRRIKLDGIEYWHVEDVLQWRSKRSQMRIENNRRVIDLSAPYTHETLEVSEAVKTAIGKRIAAAKAEINSMRMTDEQEKAYRRSIAPTKPTTSEQLASWQKEWKAAYKRRNNTISPVPQVVQASERGRGEHRDRNTHQWLFQR